MSKSNGFTLAEVLITLGIIGVVAALTMPALMAKYQNKVYASQLKKAVNTVLNGYNLMMADSGVDSIKDTEFYSVLSSDSRDMKKLDTISRKYFNLGDELKTLGTSLDKITANDIPGSAFCPAHCYLNGGVQCDKHRCQYDDVINSITSTGREYAGIRQTDLYSMPGCLLLRTADGAEICMMAYNQLFIDVNGYNKLPNKIGVDFFQVNLTDNAQISSNPLHTSADYNHCGTATSKAPGDCFQRVIKDNWEITYY